MAEVTPYRDQITPELGPNTGTDAMISAARRVGPLEREAGLAVQQGANALATSIKDVAAQRDAITTRREIASHMESHALVQGQQEADLNRLMSDPELSKDPAKLQAALKDFQANVIDKDNANWAKDFSTEAGQEWGALHAAQQGAELLKHAHSMADIISSNEALTSVYSTVNQYAANAIANPMTIDQQIAGFRSGTQGILSTISDPVKRAEVEKQLRNSEGQIAYAGVHAAIENNPAVGRQLAAKYGSIMTPEHQTAAEGYADATTKANAQQARINAAMDRQAAKDAGEDQGKQILLSMRDANGNPTVPKDFMQRMTRAAATGMSVGTFRTLMDEKDRYLTEIARGTPTPDNPAVYSDFQRRLSLDPADPQALTPLMVDQKRAEGQLSTQSAAMYRQAAEDAQKYPAMRAEQADLTKYLNSNKPDVATQQDNQAFFVFEKDRTQKFQDARHGGISARDLLDPTSPKFLGNMTDAEKANTAVSPAQQANPASAAQKQSSLAADTAVAVTSLLRDNNSDLARKTLEQAGITDPQLGNGAWCAPLVNAALKSAGLQGTGSGLASSFLTSPNLFPVSAANVQKGDIFYVPVPGYTGHVGLLTGNVRPGEVEVVSSHLKGDPSNPGGVEWRSTEGMVFRRAKPTLDDIRPQTYLGQAWGAVKSGVRALSPNGE